MDNEIVQDIKAIQHSAFIKKNFGDLEQHPNPVYFVMGPMFEKAHAKQRGYIHGLSKKLGIDDTFELPYILCDVRQLLVYHAAEVIEILKDEVDGISYNTLF